ncbi:unnamed protein product, partial [Choristocarpus tenellus]
YLLHGVQIDAEDSTGRTALHVAAQNGQTEALKELLCRSVDVNALDTFGCTPLHNSAYSDKVR